jgi:predicted DNA-binding transcriptional regulator AlpA
MSDRIYLNTLETARRLGLKPKTLERWRWAGSGPPFVKLGRCARYDQRVVDAWAAERSRTSTSDPGPEREA